MDSELETAILAALPADMDHRITFSTLMDRMRLSVGAAVSYLEISDLLDDLVTAGRVACWEFDDDGWKTYSLPQPAEPESWESDTDWQARALAAEAERDRLREQATRHRRAIKAALTLAQGPRTVDAVAIEVAIAGPLTAEDIGEIARVGVTPRPVRDPEGTTRGAWAASIDDGETLWTGDTRDDAIASAMEAAEERIRCGDWSYTPTVEVHVFRDVLWCVGPQPELCYCGGDHTEHSWMAVDYARDGVEHPAVDADLADEVDHG